MAALVLLCAAQFMVILDITVVNVALPSIQADLAIPIEDLQWVVTAYTLAFGGLLLLGGRAADLLGRRRMFLAGLALFGTASLAASLAASTEALLAARAAQGVGATMLSPAALSLITTIFPDGPERPRRFRPLRGGGARAARGAQGVSAPPHRDRPCPDDRRHGDGPVRLLLLVPVPAGGPRSLRPAHGPRVPARRGPLGDRRTRRRPTRVAGRRPGRAGRGDGARRARW